VARKVDQLDHKASKVAPSYTFDVTQTIARMLDNPTIAPHIHQGPAQFVVNRQEVYEGDAWRESIVLSGGRIPFNLHNKAIYPSVCVEYTDTGGVMDESTTKLGRVKGYMERTRGPNREPEQLFEIEPLIPNTDLRKWKHCDGERPSSSESASSGSNDRPLLILDTRTIIVPAKFLIKRVSVYFCGKEPQGPRDIPARMCLFEVRQVLLEDHEDVEGKANQIHLESASCLKPLLAETELIIMPMADRLYRFRGMLEACDHVFLGTDEFGNLDPLDVNSSEFDQLPHYDIAIQIYTDKFGIFRTTHRNAGGIYMSILNLPLKVRSLLKNWLLLGFTPYGSAFEDTIVPIFRQIKEFQFGKPVTLPSGRRIILSIKLLYTCCDMPESNDLAGVKRQSSLKPCRFCLVDRDRLSDASLSVADLYRMGRGSVQMDKSRVRAKRLPPARRELELRKYGLHLMPSPMVHHGLAFDPYRQTALDADHSELGSHGLGKHLIHLTIHIFLSDAGRCAFTNTFRNFPFPATWNRLLNPCTHLLKYRFADIAHMVSVGPFLLRRFLKPQHISSKMAAEYQTVFPESRLLPTRVNLAITAMLGHGRKVDASRISDIVYIRGLR